MAKIILIIGRSGVGKSASLRNIPDDLYTLIEVAGKPLPYRSSKKFITSDSYADISRFIHDERAKPIIVLDDSQYLMANEFMRRAKEKGFEKFTEIGLNFWNLIREAGNLPDDKTVYFLHHSETDADGNVKEKTIGKLLDEKICIAGMFSIIFHADMIDGEYFFATQTNGKTTAKTPMGMFDKKEVPNDIWAIDKVIRDYYGMKPLETAPAPSGEKAEKPVSEGEQK